MRLPTLPRHRSDRPLGPIGWAIGGMLALAVAVIDNRTTRPRAYSRVDGKNWDRLGLSRTRPGHWMGATTPGQWQREHDGPVRLQITCRRGDEQWVLPRETQVPEPGCADGPTRAGNGNDRFRGAPR
jgi:hypothetical protein